MKREDVVREISSKTDLPMYQCDKVIEALIDVVKGAMLDGEKVIIKGFISFEPTERKARRGYNPSNQKMQNFPSVRTVNCKIGKTIKNAMNEN